MGIVKSSSNILELISQMADCQNDILYDIDALREEHKNEPDVALEKLIKDHENLFIINGMMQRAAIGFL